jgi:hypothetical protein
MIVFSKISRSLIATFCVSLVCALAQMPSYAQAPVRVSGTAISLVPPTGFKASTRFSGFEHGEVQASIMITELPGPFSEVGKMLMPEQLAKQRMTLAEKSDVVVNGDKAVLAYVSQRYAGEDFLKWMLIVGNESKTRMIVATFPKDDETRFKDAMKAALLSTSWSNDAIDHFDGLRYTLQAAEPLKLAGRVSNLLMFTETGQTRVASIDDALFVFGNSIADRDLANLRAFSEARILQTARMSEIKIVSSKAMKIAGLDAHEIVAEAKDTASRTPMLLYQSLIADDKTYYIAQGMVSAARGNAVLPHFKTTTASFKKR